MSTDELTAEAVIGRVEGADLEVGLHGWAYNPQDRSQPVEVQLWAGDTLIAATAADRFRADLGSDSEPDFNPGFVFPATVLRTAALNLSIHPEARLTVRPKGSDFGLPGFTLPNSAALAELVEDSGAPPADTSGLDLRAALDALIRHAPLIRKRPLRPIATGAKGVIETAALLERDKIAIGGWIERGQDLEQAAALLDGEKYDAAFSLAVYDRRDLPDYAQGFVGVLQTAWRPTSRGSEPFVFFGPQGEFHLRSSGPIRPQDLHELEAALEQIPPAGGHSRVLELRHLLLAHQGWSHRGDMAANLGLALSIDRAVILPGFGAAAEGWVLTGPRRIASMSLRLGAAVLDLDPATRRISARPDLAKGYPALKESAPTAGFSGFFVGPLHIGDLLDPMFKVQFTDGVTITAPINPGLLQICDSRFDTDNLAPLVPSLATEPRFPQFVSARSELIRREIAQSVQSVIRARGERGIFLTLPKNESDLTLVLETAARNVRRLGPSDVLAFIADAGESRERILPWINEVAAHAAGAGVSLTLVDTVEHALYAVERLLSAHRAERFGFAGPHVWLTDQGWEQMASTLHETAAEDADAAPVYLSVATQLADGSAPGADAELFVWTQTGLQRWLSTASVPFDAAAASRGLPTGRLRPGGASGVRLVSAGRSAYKSGLDRAAGFGHRPLVTVTE